MQPQERRPIVCDHCGKRTDIPFDGLFEHVEFEAVKAGFKLGQDKTGHWWTRCEECCQPRSKP